MPSEIAKSNSSAIKTRKKSIFPETPAIHVGLFLVTIFSVMFVYLAFWGGSASTLSGAIFEAFVFASALLAILMSHELGHFLAARFHGIKATLPYFIPAPIGIGTFGAFIQIQGRLRTRKELLDVGVAGPLAGMIVTLFLAIGGIVHSEFVPLNKPAFQFGEPLIFQSLIYLIKGTAPEGMDLALSPIGFAAWLGFLVTALNLMPASQLDGGHVIYALFGKGHRYISRGVFLFLVFWGIWGDFFHIGIKGLPTGIALSILAIVIAFSKRQRILLKRLLVALVIGHFAVLIGFDLQTDTSMWLFWGMLLYLFKLDHPPIKGKKADGELLPQSVESIGTTRKLIGVLTIILFVGIFMLTPIRVFEP